MPSGGYTSARREIVELLREKSLPYFFSNTLAPVIAAASVKMFDMLSANTKLRDKLEDNTKYFRLLMKQTGFDIIESEHPIVAVIFYDVKKAAEAAEKLLEM